MNNKHFFGIMLLIASAAVIIFASCNKIPVGYLRTTNASFAPDTLSVYRNIDPMSDRYINQSPWVSTRIQGVAGTNPINYAYASVKASAGGDADKFEQMVKNGHLKVDGGVVVLLQKGVEEIPNGRYRISLHVYNDGHSASLNDIFTIIVQDNEN